MYACISHVMWHSFIFSGHKFAQTLTHLHPFYLPLLHATHTFIYKLEKTKEIE